MDVTSLKDSLSSEKHAHNVKRYLTICHGVKFLREDTNKLTEKNSVEEYGTRRNNIWLRKSLS